MWWSLIDIMDFKHVVNVLEPVFVSSILPAEFISIINTLYSFDKPLVAMETNNQCADAFST